MSYKILNNHLKKTQSLGQFPVTLKSVSFVTTMCGHILNVIDRQKEIFQKDNAQPITARVTMDFLTQNNINVLLGHITTYGPT
jgi:hypothetical protein